MRCQADEPAQRIRQDRRRQVGREGAHRTDRRQTDEEAGTPRNCDDDAILQAAALPSRWRGFTVVPDIGCRCLLCHGLSPRALPSSPRTRAAACSASSPNVPLYIHSSPTIQKSDSEAGALASRIISSASGFTTDQYRYLCAAVATKV